MADKPLYDELEEDLAGPSMSINAGVLETVNGMLELADYALMRDTIWQDHLATSGNASEPNDIVSITGASLPTLISSKQSLQSIVPPRAEEEGSATPLSSRPESPTAVPTPTPSELSFNSNCSATTDLNTHPSEYTAHGISSPADCTTESPMVSQIGNESSIHQSSARTCMNCRVTSTPFWRRTADGEIYCNACGLYLRSHKKMRPLSLQRSRESRRQSSRSDICANCETKETPLWRKTGEETVCNACGLYFRLHGKHRPKDAPKLPPRIGRASKRQQRTLLPKNSTDSCWYLYQPPQPAMLSSSSLLTNPSNPSANQGTTNNHSRLMPNLATGRLQLSQLSGKPNIPMGMPLVAAATQAASHIPHPAAFNPAAFLSFTPGGGGSIPTGTTHSSDLLRNAAAGANSAGPANPSLTMMGMLASLALPSRPVEYTNLDDSMRWFTSTCLQMNGAASSENHFDKFANSVLSPGLPREPSHFHQGGRSVRISPSSGNPTSGSMVFSKEASHHPANLFLS